MKENNLEEIVHIMDASARLVANRVSFRLKFDRIYSLTEKMKQILTERAEGNK